MAEELKACPCCHQPASPAGLKHAGCMNADCMLSGMWFEWDKWQNTRAHLHSQGGEAVEVLTTWHPDSRSYEEQIVSHDTKGSRKALGAMNAKLRVKVGRLERELAAVKQSLTVEPVAYAAFAENGNIRMWCRSAIGMCELFDAHGNKAVPLYTHPADQVEDDLTMVKVSRELLEQIAVELEHDNDRYFLGRELRALLVPSPQ